MFIPCVARYWASISEVQRYEHQHRRTNRVIPFPAHVRDADGRGVAENDWRSISAARRNLSEAVDPPIQRFVRLRHMGNTTPASQFREVIYKDPFKEFVSANALVGISN